MEAVTTQVDWFQIILCSSKSAGILCAITTLTKGTTFSLALQVGTCSLELCSLSLLNAPSRCSRTASRRARAAVSSQALIVLMFRVIDEVDCEVVLRGSPRGTFARCPSPKTNHSPQASSTPALASVCHTSMDTVLSTGGWTHVLLSLPHGCHIDTDRRRRLSFVSAPGRGRCSRSRGRCIDGAVARGLASTRPRGPWECPRGAPAGLGRWAGEADDDLRGTLEILISRCPPQGSRLWMSSETSF